MSARDECDGEIPLPGEQTDEPWSSLLAPLSEEDLAEIAAEDAWEREQNEIWGRLAARSDNA